MTHHNVDVTVKHHRWVRVVVLVSIAVVGYLSLWVGEAQAQTPDYYVDADAPCNPCGGTLGWTDAFTNLQDALAVATATNEIWVAAGTYYPDEGAGQINNDRTSTFTLLDGVAIYGGFAATETLRTQRNFTANLTVLSGDIQQDNPITTTNAYHVVTGSGTDNTALLDGFTVTAGNANGSSPNNRGGGMYNDNSNPTIQNVAFSGNTAALGGGMRNNNSSNPSLNTVTFTSNEATNSGGGMRNDNSNPILTNTPD